MQKLRNSINIKKVRYVYKIILYGTFFCNLHRKITKKNLLSQTEKYLIL